MLEFDGMGMTNTHCARDDATYEKRYDDLDAIKIMCRWAMEFQTPTDGHRGLTSLVIQDGDDA